MGEKDTRIGRRDFLKSTTTTAAAAAGFMIVRPEAVRGTAANSAVQLGIIGCGGRGTSVASSMMENTNLRVVAIADVFQDRLGAGNQRFSDLARENNFSKISRGQLFRGSNGYQRLAESRHVDAVLVSSPPYLHPDHLEAVVAAGKHAYCEKPVGVDVYGCKRVVRIGERAQGKDDSSCRIPDSERAAFCGDGEENPRRCAGRNCLRPGVLLFRSVAGAADRRSVRRCSEDSKLDARP